MLCKLNVRFSFIFFGVLIDGCALIVTAEETPLTRPFTNEHGPKQHVASGVTDETDCQTALPELLESSSFIKLRNDNGREREERERETETALFSLQNC